MNTCISEQDPEDKHQSAKDLVNFRARYEKPEKPLVTSTDH